MTDPKPPWICTSPNCDRAIYTTTSKLCNLHYNRAKALNQVSVIANTRLSKCKYCDNPIGEKGSIKNLACKQHSYSLNKYNDPYFAENNRPIKKIKVVKPRGKDYTGQTINGFTFIKFIGHKRNIRRWEIQCHCGNVFEGGSSNIVRGQQKYCRKCIKHQRGKRAGANPCFKDYTNQTINNLKFIKVSHKVGKTYKWVVKCVCGKEFISAAYDIVNNSRISCGCRKKLRLRPIPMNLANRTLGQLYVEDIAYFGFDLSSFWYCKCSCGKNIVKSINYLTNNNPIKSCGCHQIKNRSGQNCNRWTVGTIYEKRHNTIYWLCTCICGVTKYLSTHTLRKQKSPGCGCHIIRTEEDKKQAQQQYWKNKVNNETAEQRLRRLAIGKEWYEANKARILAERQEEYKHNPEKREKLKASVRAYNKTTKGKISHKKHKKGPRAKIRNAVHKRLHKLLKLKDLKLRMTFNELIGCSPDELKKHLENQFQPGMTWDNHGLYGWHIDHIRPCASFDLTDPEQQKQCSHYTNLQPLWAQDNLDKGATWTNAA